MWSVKASTEQRFSNPPLPQDSHDHTKVDNALLHSRKRLFLLLTMNLRLKSSDLRPVVTTYE